MNLRIRTKVLLTISLLLILTLGISDTVWFLMIRPILTTQLQESQQQIGFRAADKVKDFLDAKTRALIVHAQSAALLTQNKDLETLELSAFFSQDQDIEKISLMDEKGMEQIAVNRMGFVDKVNLQDKKQSPAFIASTFRYSKEYLSEVTFINNKPVITIAVPITIPDVRHRLTNLSTSTSVSIISKQKEILGVLEVTVSIDRLFDELTSLGTIQSGYLYVVDKQGAVIAHRNKTFSNGNVTFQNFLPVKRFIDHTEKDTTVKRTSLLSQYTNENNEEVLGTYVTVPETSWAVIIQQPSSLALADFTTVTRFALFLILGGLLVSAPITYFLTKKFTDPIRDLANTAHLFGIGKLEYRVHIQSDDELGELGDAFNLMATHIEDTTQKLERDKDIISAERNKIAVILSGISDAVIAVDISRNIILFNSIAESITGYSQTDVIGKPIDTLFQFSDEGIVISPTTYCPIRLDEFEGVLWSKKNVRLQTPSVHEAFVNIVASQIKEGKRVSVGCILTLHDVSQEQQLEEMKLDFVSMAAHELRTPITAIVGYTNLLKQNSDKLSSEDQDSVQKLTTSSANLLNLTNNLLNISRIEQGKLTMKNTPLHIGEIINEVVKALTDLAKEKEQQVVVIEDVSSLPTILADTFRVKQVLTNLIDNAIKYTPEKGTITISGRKREDTNKQYIEISVADTGPGISKDDQAHLFTKFFRANDPLIMQNKGIGLGLFISKSIIEMQEGKIWVESEEGKGTKFIFTLPISPQSDSTDSDETRK